MIDKSLVQKLIKDKASVEKNEFYKYIFAEVRKQLVSVQEHIGNMRTATLDEIRFEQGKLGSLKLLVELPDKLMDKLIKEQ